MNCELDQLVKIVGAFVAKTRGVSAGSVHAGSKLFQEGFVDSFSLVELTAELEAALGVSIPDGTLIPEDFETPQAVFERLCQV